MLSKGINLILLLAAAAIGLERKTKGGKMLWMLYQDDNATGAAAAHNIWINTTNNAWILSSVIKIK